MQSGPRYIGIVAGVAAFLLAATLTVAPAKAQQVTGELGSASATTTLEGNQLPPLPPAFGGVINESASGPRRRSHAHGRGPA
jgi:hypothetical protein